LASAVNSNCSSVMAPGPSKESSESDNEKESKDRKIRALKMSCFQAVIQHCCILQAEATLVNQLANGNSTDMAKMLGNTAGAVGILGLFVNQFGGKLSDQIGRRPGLLIGPLVNFISGMLIVGNPRNKSIVLACRMLRLIFTTFSGAVMGQAALSDMASGKELSMIMNEINTCLGAAVIIAPTLEKIIISLSGNNPLYSYLFQALSAAATFIINYNFIGETLDPTKAVKFTPADANPFNFVKIFTRGSKALQKLLVISTLQTAIANISDTEEVWKRSHLGWTASQSANDTIAWGFLMIIASVKVTPSLLRRYSARGFTSFTNITTAIGFMLRGSVENSLVFLAAVLPMLPGVNGATALALDSISTDIAEADGIGKGEFSGWSNNLRALMASFASILFANYYAWAQKRNVYPGTVFMLGGIICAVLPELMMNCVSDEELKAPKLKDTPSSGDQTQAKVAKVGTACSAE